MYDRNGGVVHGPVEQGVDFVHIFESEFHRIKEIGHVQFPYQAFVVGHVIVVSFLR